MKDFSDFEDKESDDDLPFGKEEPKSRTKVERPDENTPVNDKFIDENEETADRSEMNIGRVDKLGGINPAVVTVKITGGRAVDGKRIYPIYTFSSINVKDFIEKLGFRFDTNEKNERKETGRPTEVSNIESVTHSVEYATNGEYTVYTIRFKNEFQDVKINMSTPRGKIATGHGQFAIYSKEQMRVLEKNTNIRIGKGKEVADMSGDNQFVVYEKENVPQKKVQEYKPLSGNIKYDGDVINEEALSKMQDGDKVTYVVKNTDAYNQELYGQYREEIKGETDPKKLQEAKNRLAGDLVIRIYDKDGEFVSVLAAQDNLASEELWGIRKRAVDAFLGTVEEKGQLSSKQMDEKRADIERRRKEEILSVSDYFVKRQEVGPNTDITTEDIEYIESVIEHAIENGWDLERLERTLWLSYTNALVVNYVRIKEYLRRRLDGTITVKVGVGVLDSINAKYDAELAALENVGNQGALNAEYDGKVAEIERERVEKLAALRKEQGDDVDFVEYNKISDEYDRRRDELRDRYPNRDAQEKEVEDYLQQELTDRMATAAKNKSIDGMIEEIEQQLEKNPDLTFNTEAISAATRNRIIAEYLVRRKERILMSSTWPLEEVLGALKGIRGDKKMGQNGQGGQTGDGFRVRPQVIDITGDEQPSTYVLPGRPNLLLVHVGDNAHLSQMKFDVTEDAEGVITDIGFVYNGGLFTRNQFKEGVHLDDLGIMGRLYTGDLPGRIANTETVPVVIIKAENGHEYVYPVNLKYSETNVNEWVDSTDPKETALKIAMRDVQTNIKMKKGEMFIAPKLLLKDRNNNKAVQKPSAMDRQEVKSQNKHLAYSAAPSTNVEGLGRLSEGEANRLVDLMEANAVPMPDVEYTHNKWVDEFGDKDGKKIIITPHVVGEVVMGDNQEIKLSNKERAGQFGMIKPTLTNPDVIIAEQSREGSVVNERETSMLFVKTFANKDGQKYTHFESVTVSQGKKEVVVSSHVLRPKQLLDKLQAGRIVYTATALNASGQTFAEYTSRTESGAPALKEYGKGNVNNSEFKELDKKKRKKIPMTVSEQLRYIAYSEGEDEALSQANAIIKQIEDNIEGGRKEKGLLTRARERYLKNHLNFELRDAVLRYEKQLKEAKDFYNTRMIARGNKKAIGLVERTRDALNRSLKKMLPPSIAPSNLYQAALLYLMKGGVFRRNDFDTRIGYNNNDLGAMRFRLSPNGIAFDEFEQNYYGEYRPKEFESGYESRLEDIDSAIFDYIKAKAEKKDISLLLKENENIAEEEYDELQAAYHAGLLNDESPDESNLDTYDEGEDLPFQVSERRFAALTDTEHGRLIDALVGNGASEGVVALGENEFIAEGERMSGRKLTGKNGVYYGFVANGVVYLNKDRFNANTPIHEFGHLFWNVMPAAMKSKITELLKQTPMWEQIKSDPNYENLTTDDKMADELFNTILRNYGEGSLAVREIIGGEVTMLDRVMNALNEFWRWLKALFGNTDARLERIAGMTLGEMLSGRNSGTNGALGTVSLQANIEFAKQADYDFDVSGITEANAQEMRGIKEAAIANGTFMKAPNGKDTRLNERQWLQVRTDGFKRWFGDWLLKHQSVNKILTELSPFKNNAEAINWAVENIVGTHNNKEIGEYEITKTALGKYIDRSAVNKSTSRDVHYSVLRVLPDVINNSIVGETHPDYIKGADGVRRIENGQNQYVTIHRLFGAVTIDGKDYRVKTTLREYKDKNRISKPYSYQVTEIELLAGNLANTENIDPGTNNSISAANLLNKVEKSYEKGKYILDDHSKVVDENGEPMAVAHGTNATFNAFDRNKIGSNTGSAWNGIGFYFAKEELGILDSGARWYGDIIMPSFLNIRNPFIVPANGREVGNALVSVDANIRNKWNELVADRNKEGYQTLLRDISPYNLTNTLKENGYDGVIDGEEYLAFNPNQIKSATDNNGNFDLASDDIRFQIGGGQALTSLQQKYVDEKTVAYDSRIVAANNRLKFARRERDNALKNFDQANSLFRNEFEPMNLFGAEGMTDVSDENYRRIIGPLEEAVRVAKEAYAALTQGRAAAIEGFVRDAQKMPEIFSGENLENSGNNCIFAENNMGYGIYGSSEEEYGGGEAIYSREQEASVSIARSVEAARAKQQGQLSTQQIEDIEKQSAFDYAKDKGLWIDDLYSLGSPFIGGGNENTLAYDENTQTVYKSNNLFNSQNLISELLNKVKWHNQLFPELPYELIGFTGFDNGVNRAPYVEPILKQDYVQNTTQATITEIKNEMEARGFTQVNDHTFTKGDFTVSDLRPRNVLKDTNGIFYVVDNNIIKNADNQVVREATIDHFVEMGTKRHECI